jgi:hypothetical protein
MNNINTHINNVVRRERAVTLLQDHIKPLQVCVLEGFDVWLDFANKCPEFRVAMTPRTVAGFINDWVVQHAREQFIEKRGEVEFSDDRGFFNIGFHRAIVLRFKKLDDDDGTSNIPTKQQQEIGAQCLQYRDWEAVTWVSAGYHFTKACDAIDRIAIVCHYAGRKLWDIPILDVADPESILLFDEPPVVEPRKSKVRPKNMKQPKNDT